MKILEKIYVVTGFAIFAVAQLITVVHYLVHYGSLANLFTLTSLDIDTSILHTTVSSAFIAGAILLRKRVTPFLGIVGVFEYLVSLLLVWLAYSTYFINLEKGDEIDSAGYFLLSIGSINFLVVPITLIILITAAIRRNKA